MSSGRALVWIRYHVNPRSIMWRDARYGFEAGQDIVNSGHPPLARTFKWQGTDLSIAGDRPLVKRTSTRRRLRRGHSASRRHRRRRSSQSWSAVWPIRKTSVDFGHPAALNRAVFPADSPRTHRNTTYVCLRAYNPEDGGTYRLKAEVLSPESLKIRGYWGISLLGQNKMWTRFHPS